MPSPPRLTAETRKALLLWLEKDTPHLYLCFECNGLHPWQRVAERYSNRNIISPRGGDDNWGRLGPRVPHSTIGIQFSLARAVMNRHHYGPQHGPAVTLLSGSKSKADQYYSDPELIIDESWSARIVAGELYVKSNLQLHHRDGCALPLRHYLDSAVGEIARLVCHQVGMLHPFLGVCRIRELERAPDSTDPLVIVAGALKSCRYCFTDYRVDVQFAPRNRSSSSNNNTRAIMGWVVSVTRWQCLGACRSPQDIKWRNYTSPKFPCPPRADSCRPGALYRS